MEWPPEFILARLRQSARDKLQPSELLTILRELALQYKAFLANNAWSGPFNPESRVREPFRVSGATRARCSKRANCWLRFTGGLLRVSTRAI
jgi:hypothetical protein